MSPQPLPLAPRKFEAWLGLGIGMLILVAAVFPLPALAAWLFPAHDWIAAIATGLVGVAVGGSAVVGCWRRVRMRGPAILLDESGLTDHRRDGFSIRWNEVAGMKADFLHDRIVIRRRRSAATTGGSALRRTAAGVARVLRGGDIVIELNDVKYDIRTLERTIAAYMARPHGRTASPH